MDDNFGVKVSLPGYSVSSASPEQSSLDSIYDTFKLKLNNISALFGLVTFLFNVEPPTPGSGSEDINLFKVKHGYNYQPYIIVMNIDATFPAFSSMSTALPFVQLNGVGGTNSGIFSVSGNDNSGFRAYADDTFFYIDVHVDSAKTFNFYGKFYTFKYYIFAEDGF